MLFLDSVRNRIKFLKKEPKATCKDRQDFPRHLSRKSKGFWVHLVSNIQISARPKAKLLWHLLRIVHVFLKKIVKKVKQPIRHKSPLLYQVKHRLYMLWTHSQYDFSQSLSLRAGYTYVQTVLSNQNFLDAQIIRFYYPWCSAGKCARKLRYYPLPFPLSAQVAFL